MQRRRVEEALAEFRKAEELDPLSPIIRSCIPEWYYFVGRNDEAVEHAKRALQLFPEFKWLRKLLAAAYIRAGKYHEALAEVKLRRVGAENHPAGLDMLSFCHARLGDETEARRLLSELKEWQKKGYDVDAEIAYAHLGLREYDQAVESYRRLVVSDTHYEEILYNPLLMDEMHSHLGFIALLRELGLECERQQATLPLKPSAAAPAS
jgi:tetratricopeptide (TPR) repeat protein